MQAFQASTFTVAATAYATIKKADATILLPSASMEMNARISSQS